MLTINKNYIILFLLIEYVPHKVSEVEVAIFISKVIESVGLDEIT